ncbi:MAG: hypothetical protein PHN51_00710 [Candidatus Nanopelagicales bacterium]|nr:hypothetical protein [Candidatus Nanopelagicales bacterium]
MTSRTRLSLLLAGLTSACLVLWVIWGFDSSLINIVAGALSLSGASAAIWLAWTNGSPQISAADHMLDRTFT